MPVWAWIVGGVSIWAGLLVVLISSIKKERKQKAASLAELGLEVLATSAVNVNAMVGPRIVARGQVADLPVSVEDFVGRPEEGHRSTTTRIRAQLALPLPDLLLSAHNYAAPEKSQPTRMRSFPLPSPFSQWLAAYGSDAKAEGILRVLTSAPELVTLSGPKCGWRVGTLCELSIFAGEITIVLQGMPSGKDRVGPALGLIEKLARSAASQA